MSKILVIEDDQSVRELLRIILTKKDFEVLTAEDGLAGLRSAYHNRPDVIILDVMMPGMDGYETCQRLREMTDTPILLLTGQRTDTEDVVKGFGLGADEYMTKPFSSEELISRIRACLRRSGTSEDRKSRYFFPATSMVLDCGRHELKIADRIIYLTPSEFEVLELLVRHHGHTLSREAILLQAWGPQHIGDTDLVKQYIYQLRQKIEPDPTSPKYIHTVRGAGYYFSAAGQS
jgi:DNA-binding response OmpR family regulator